MGWFKKMLRLENQYEEVKEEASPRVDRKQLKNFLVRVVGLVRQQGLQREGLEYPEYDLDEIRVAAEADSYIKQALMKYSYLVFKAGYQIKSENEKAAEYIKTRFRIMSFATQKPVDILFQEIADDLIKYSNAFLVKSRVDVIMPGVKAIGIFKNKPVGGYFRVDPTTVSIKRDKHGKVLQYRQTVDGEEKTYDPVDVIHFYLDKEPNSAFGTPRIIAALEDVKLLRKIEGNIISLIYRFAIPIYQWVVGLPEPGMQATEKDIEDARYEIEKMAMDGFVITNERTKINAIGAEGEALDASEYLKYFERRVFTALGVSESQMGRGGSKQDADSMEAQVHDTVKHIQRILSIFIENYMINELLLEGGFNPILNEKDIVRFEFREISLDTIIKLENHEMLKFQSNVATFEETRKSLGKKEEADESRLYANMIQTKAAINQIEAKADNEIRVRKELGQTASTGVSGIKGNGQTVSTKPNDDVATRNRPANQYGIFSVKIKEQVEEPRMLDSIYNKSKEKNRKTYASIYNKYYEVRNDIVKRRGDLDLILPVARDAIFNELRQFIQMAAEDGISKARKDAKTPEEQVYSGKISLSDLEEHAKKRIENLLKDIRKRVKKGEDPDSVFNTLEYRLRFLIEYIIPKAYWYAYVKTLHRFGIDEVEIRFNGSDDEKEHDKIVKTNRFSLDDIPAFHPFCDCKVVPKR